MSFTFVTALYNISREQYDQRSYQQYQTWFERTLSIPVPMVIFTEICNEDIVKRARSKYDNITKVIYTSLDEVPFYYTVDTVRDIITNSPFKRRIQHPNGLENKCFGYIPIIHSKYAWMNKAIESNYFNSDMFFWIDAGLSRFLNFDIADGHFNNPLISQIHNENKIFIQLGKVNEFAKVLNNELSFYDAVGKNINFMMAGFWGGNSSLMMEVCKIGEKMYIEDLIGKQQVDNEQVTFGFILKQYKHNLLCTFPCNVECINYYVFCDKVTIS
uniref:Uncharacterized protein n=1 Tax=viral metagenome TaxID=1070528 RepID=A0A6C0ART0_9ZZZZ